MKTKTHFAFRIDIWDSSGVSIVEHVSGVDVFEVAVTTYWAAVTGHLLVSRYGRVLG